MRPLQRGNLTPLSLFVFDKFFVALLVIFSLSALYIVSKLIDLEASLNAHSKIHYFRSRKMKNNDQS
jgi:hypothetical protein